MNIKQAVQIITRTDEKIFISKDISNEKTPLEYIQYARNNNAIKDIEVVKGKRWIAKNLIREYQVIDVDVDSYNYYYLCQDADTQKILKEVEKTRYLRTGNKMTKQYALSYLKKKKLWK